MNKPKYQIFDLVELNSGVRAVIVYREGMSTGIWVYALSLDKDSTESTIYKEEDLKSIKGKISIDVDFFDHLLNCLANQKFIGELPCCGDAMALGKDKYNDIQKENQRIIDEAWNKGMEILNKHK